MKELIKQIQKENIKIYLSITGGGTGAVANLLKYGGSSEIFMEAKIPYNQECLVDFLKQTPQKYCSELTARMMAVTSYESAKNKNDKNIGIGMTCSLAKENEREERENWIYIAIHSSHDTCSFAFKLSKKLKFLEKRSLREIQEEEASNALIKCLLFYLGKQNDFKVNYSSYDYSHFEPQNDYLNDNKSWIGLNYPKYNKHQLIMPGSFNPMHEEHLRISKIASMLTKKDVTFEISMKNFEKPTIDFLECKKRLEQINSFLYNDNSHVNSVILTNAPLFSDKIKLFNEATFIIGYDTYNRLSRSTNNFDIFKNTKFIVFHRSGYELERNEDFDKQCTFVSEEIFHDTKQMSSTNIRNNQKCTQL